MEVLSSIGSFFVFIFGVIGILVMLLVFDSPASRIVPLIFLAFFFGALDQKILSFTCAVMFGWHFGLC